jgi:anhydro-N-acetylmuramic acid kinase
MPADLDTLQKKPCLTMVGLMTGTSMDGLDICVAEVDLKEESAQFNVLGKGSVSYSDKMRADVETCLEGDSDVISQTHVSLGRFMAVETEKFLRANELIIIDAIAMHGQTVHHVSGESSLQIGEPSFLAQALNVPVILDFRSADIAAGGTGAPLIPIVDKWLFQRREEAVICMNLGGVANVTYLPSKISDEPILGFDTGPGMGLLDEASKALTGNNFDEDGTLAQAGTAHEKSVEGWLRHSFITASPPKSTGRDEFGADWISEQLPDMKSWKVNDVLATLSLFTAQSVAVNCRENLPLDSVKQILISGGGVYNKSVMNQLKTEFSSISILTSNDFGIDPFMKEALGFAMLGAAHLKGIPGNLPSVTGASEAVILGKLIV